VIPNIKNIKKRGIVMKKNQLAVCVIIVLTVLALGSFRSINTTDTIIPGYNDEKKQQQMNYKIMLVIAAGALGYFAYTKIEE